MIAKSAPSATPVVLEPNQQTVGFNSFEYDGVDLSLFEMYGIDYTDDVARGRLKDINNWISADLEEKTIGNVMMKLRDLDTKLGATPAGGRRIDRIWNHLKISQKMKDLMKQQRALER